MSFSLPARSSSLLLPSFFRIALSKSNSTSAASVTFWATGAGFAAGFAAAGGGGGGGITAGAFGVRSGSHSGIAIAGVQFPPGQQSPGVFFQTVLPGPAQ